MPHPKCPNCRERMSMSELGLAGVWSCIYCEGVWLNDSEVRRLLTSAEASGAAPRSLERLPCTETALTCPTCQAPSFVQVVAGSAKAHCCTNCHSLFFDKGTLPEHALSALSGVSGPEVAGKALAAAVGWLILSILPLGMP